MQNKKSPINTKNEHSNRLYANLFSEEDKLPDVKGYHYGTILIDEVICIKFSMIIKSTYAICYIIKKVFNKIEKIHRQRNTVSSV